LLLILAPERTRLVSWVEAFELGIIVVGLVGAFLAGLVINLLLPNTTLGFFATIVAAFLGAVVLLAIMHFGAGLVGRSKTSS